MGLSGRSGVNCDFAEMRTVNLAGGLNGRTTFDISGSQLSELWDCAGPETMTINGDANDTVSLSGFTEVDNTMVDGTSYHQWEYGSCRDVFTLLVDADIMIE